VSRECSDVERSCLDHRAGSSGERATRDGHVVADHGVVPAHIADHLGGHRLLVLRAVVRHDRGARAPQVREAARRVHPLEELEHAFTEVIRAGRDALPSAFTAAHAALPHIRRYTQRRSETGRMSHARAPAADVSVPVVAARRRAHSCAAAWCRRMSDA